MMSGGFFAGRRSWIIIGAALLAAALLLMLARGSQEQTSGMTELEARLSATLSGIEGAGRVRAMVLADTEAGAFVAESGAQEVRGVIIVAQGAYDVGVRLSLQRAAMTLFSLPAERVEVFSGWEGEFE